MQKACKTMGYITLIFGIIGTIILAVVCGKETIQILTAHERRSWALTFAYLFSGSFSTAVLTIIFFSIAEILEYLQYFYENNQSETETNSTFEYKGAVWKCECGRTNPAYTGTCACGRTKN